MAFLKCDPPDSSKPPVLKYRISGLPDGDVTTDAQPDGSLHYDLGQSNLEPDLAYPVEVFAINMHGEAKKPATAMVSIELPDTPANISVGM